MKELYQVLSSMMGQEDRIAQIANNLANVNTVGFKRQGVAFEDYMKQAQQPDGAEGASPAEGGSANPAAMAWPVLGAGFTNFAPGVMQTTGRPLDLAIDGDGFFQVQGETGKTLFTRAGNFTLSAAGQIVTMDGRPVLSDGGAPLAINPAGGHPQIANDGTISQDGSPVGRIGVVNFQDPKKLERRGNGMLEAPAGVAPSPVAVPVVRPGTLEGSNVNPIAEMTDMIQAQRTYEVNQKVIQTIDDITGKRISAAMS